MAYKDILVYLDPTADAADRVRLAASLAKTHGAKLIGVDATANDRVAGDLGAEALRALFDEAAREAPGSVYFPASDSEYGDIFSHCVDLIIAPSPAGPARRFLRHRLFDEALLESGAPVLILPEAWKLAQVGETIVIAWNGGREALRAVHDAMPLLQRARKVDVFTFSSRPSTLRASAEALIQHLAGHGVAAAISDWTHTGDLSAVDALFASVDEQQSDLVVTGAFGHSRLYEGLFGGVTFDLLRGSPLPVLMSH